MAGALHSAVVGDAEGEATLADAELQPRRHDGAASFTRSLPVMPRSIAPSAHSTGMSSVRRNVTSIGISQTREEAPLLPPETEAGVGQQFGRDLGEATLAGNADAEVFCHFNLFFFKD